MPILVKGTDFSTGQQVTAANLDNLVDAATFDSGAVDNSTTQLSGGAIIVKDGGIGTAKFAAGAQFPGTTTNDSASAGYVGEVQTATLVQASAISLTTNTAANVTSLSLTAGDWDVDGTVVFLPGASTVTTSVIAALTQTSATLPSVDSFARASINASIGASLNTCLTVPTQRISLSSTTTIYLIAQSTFTTSTISACGKIFARRAR